MSVDYIRGPADEGHAYEAAILATGVDTQTDTFANRE